MTTVIGVDASLTATGIAIWHGGRVQLGTIKTTPEMGDEPERWRRICTRIWPHLRRDTLAALEAVPVYKGKSPAAQGGTVLKLGQLHGVLRYGFHARGVPLVRPQPTQVKQYATGRGGASKEEMVEAAQRLLGVYPGDDNQADAVWLMAMVLHKHGHPLAQLPVVQALVLDRVDWPQR